MMTVLSTASYASDWTRNWLDNAVYDAPSSYHGQKRGYYSGGSFNVRLDQSTEFPISVQAPKLKVGCGGIDGFMGGVSFLDADYLVEKVQGVMQAAPYVALDMAMKTMCKECSDTLNKVEQITNMLNGIQLNECAMSKPVAMAMVNQDPSALQGLWTEVTGTKNLDDAATRMWGETADKIRDNNNSPTTSLKAEVEGCSKDFKDLMADGSVIEHMADKVGMSSFTELLRGYVGDVFISSPNNAPIGVMVPNCEQNDSFDITYMMRGKGYVMKSDGKCVQQTGTSVYGYVEDMLTKIAQKLKTRAPLTAQEEKFINSSPNISIRTILMSAIQQDLVSETVHQMTEIVAIYYTNKIFDSLYSHASMAMIKAKEAASTPTTDASNKSCRPELYSPVLDKFDVLMNKSMDNRKVLSDAYKIALDRINSGNAYDESIKARQDYRTQKNAYGDK